MEPMGIYISNRMPARDVSLCVSVCVSKSMMKSAPEHKNQGE